MFATNHCIFPELSVCMWMWNISGEWMIPTTTRVIVPADDQLTCPWLIRVQLSAADAKRLKQRASDEVASHSLLPLSPLMKRSPGYASCSAAAWSQDLQPVCTKHCVNTDTTVSINSVVYSPDTYRYIHTYIQGGCRLFTCSRNTQSKGKNGCFYRPQLSYSLSESALKHLLN